MKINQNKIENPAALPIESVEVINDNNFSFTFYNYGGYIHEVNIPYLNKENIIEDVLLGYGDVDGVLNSHGYFNSIVGRVANRIGGAQFSLNDKNYKLFPNTPPNHLHGGKTGFNKKIWKIDNIEENKHSTKCVLSYFSPDMEENYPGNLDCKVIYELNNHNELSIEFHATTDQETIVNLTNHNYWNFHGHQDYYQNNVDHVVQIISATNNLSRRVVIEWEEYIDPDFYQYVLWRSEYEDMPEDYTQKIATMINSNQTVYHDRYNVSDGKKWYYKLEVQNQYGKSEISDIKLGSTRP